MTRLSLPPGIGANVLRRVTPEQPIPRDPAAWMREALDEHAWSKQREIMRSVLENRDTAVPSGHQTGKSLIASRLALWWIAAHPIGTAKVVTTAPSGHQVDSILWGNIALGHEKAGLPGTITRGQVPKWKIRGHEVGFGRKPPNHVNNELAMAMFSGTHAEHLLIIIDEAGGIPEWLWTATTTLAGNEGGKRLAIGNPDDPSTRFEKICRPGSGWHVIPVSVFDSPNFTGERVPERLRDSLVGPSYVETAKREWGESSPLYTSKVLGRFPDVADDVVITPKMVREAHERSLPGMERGRFGMDVARFGPDETVIYRNRGGVIRLMVYTDAHGEEHVMAWRKADTTVSAQRVRNMLEVPALSYVPMTIDVVGLGAGVYDPLAHAGKRVHPFNGGEAARDPSRFVNCRTEAWWAFREGCEAGLIDLDPDDELLAAQLQQPKWRLDPSGRRKRLETKEEMAKRGLKSPDRADAAVMAFYEPAQVGDPAMVLPRNGDKGTIAGDLLEALT